MAKKKVHHEKHVDETWLIPYADMLTLLLALFIVMFAMGQLDKVKFAQFSEQFKIIFKGGAGVMKDGNTIVVTLPDTTDTASIPPETSGDSSSNSSGIEGTSNGGVYNYATEQDKMNEIKVKLEEAIAKSGYMGKVVVSINSVGLEISLQEVALFNSGQANVIEGVNPLLTEISKMLKMIDNKIKIEGHTDNVPIHTQQYKSNWDLSAMRAINVMYYFIDNNGLPPERFSVQGFGEYSPKFDNSTEEGRANNRRVEISLIRKYPYNGESLTYSSSISE